MKELDHAVDGLKEANKDSAMKEVTKVVKMLKQILDKGNIILIAGEKDYKAAISTAELALSKSNNEPIIVDTLGWALFQDGQIDAALLRLRDARLRSPSNPEVRYHLAATLAKAGKRTEARDELQAALRENLPFEGQAEAKALLDTLK